MRTAAPAALLLLAACAAPLRTTVPADEAARRRPENRSGVLVGDELLRLTWLPPLDASPAAASADPATFTGIRGGPPQRWLVASKTEGGRSVLTFAGHPSDWERNLIKYREGLEAALQTARETSPFHAPVEVKLGAATVWAVGDLVPTGVLRPGGESLGTMELYESRPGPGASLAPMAILVVARRLPSGEEVRRQDLGLISRPDGFFRVARVARTPEGQLTGLEFAAWQPDPKAVLGGLTAQDVLGAGHPRELDMEHQLTDTLLEWKTRELQGWASAATPAALEDAVVATEKGMLALDLKSRVVKDAIDAAAREGAGSQPGMTEKAQLLDQRKTVIGAVLGTLKAARAARLAAPPPPPPAPREPPAGAN